jgi:hypothetical protein
MGGNSAGEDEALDVAADPLQVVNLVTVADSGHVLIDDRTGVELLGDVVGGRADQLDAALVRAAIRVRADEGRQEAVVDVDRRGIELPQELGREDLHVAGEDEQVDSRQQFQRPRLRFVAGVGVHRHIVERQAEGFDLSCVVGMVGDDGDDIGAKLAAAPAPEQVGETVVFARDHDRDPLGLAGLGEAEVHLEARRDLPLEASLQVFPLVLGNRVEDHPHEETALVAGVLVGIDDVEAGLGEEATHGGDQPGPVGAGEQQARCRVLRESLIIAGRLVPMRVTAAPDGLIERLGLLLNRVPTPIGEAMLAMPVARSLQVAQSTGMLEALAEGPRDPAELAEHLGLQAAGTELVLDVIASLGHVELQPDGRYEMTERARRWLDPRSDQYLGDFLADTGEYWKWWQDLEGLVRDGRHVELHDKPPEDPYWRSYIRGQYQLARLSSDELAKAVPLARNAHSLLDVAGAGAHGEYSMALCRRHPGLKATIIDLPGSARVGREIVSGAAMDDRVHHVEGDMFETDFGGPHDGALCFNIVHHLTPDQARELFTKARAALRPGAPLCVLELYDRPDGQKPDSGSILGLFFHLTSGADTYTVEQVSTWLADSGFGSPSKQTFRTLPSMAMLSAKAI